MIDDSYDEDDYVEEPSKKEVEGVRKDSLVRVTLWVELALFSVVLVVCLILFFSGLLRFSLLLNIMIGLFFLFAFVLIGVAVYERRDVGGKVKLISQEVAKRIADRVVLGVDVAEYCDRIINEGVEFFGRRGAEVPVFVRKFESHFEKCTVVVLVNMQNRNTAFEFFDPMNVGVGAVNKRVGEMANRLVSCPAENADTEEEVVTGVDGTRTVRRRSVARKPTVRKVRYVKRLEDIR